MCEADFTCDEGQYLADRDFFEQEAAAARKPEQKSKSPALIQVVQLPVISQHIEEKSWEVERKVKMALHLAVSPDTLSECKKVRSELNKELSAINDEFKAVKEMALAPWNEVEKKYKAGIRDKYAAADRDLADKIHDVENGIISGCEAEMKEYFSELIQAEHVEWLRWEDLGIKISLTEAKQKTHKKIREMIALNVTGIAQDVTTIADHEDAEEIMAEYKQCLCLGQAIGAVQDRHRRIEEERKKKEEWEAHRKAQQEAAAKVEAVVPTPTPIPAPVPVSAPVEPQKVFKLNFSVTGTKEQLIEFKKMFIEYCKKEGLNYV